MNSGRIFRFSLHAGVAARADERSKLEQENRKTGTDLLNHKQENRGGLI
jgi:hypothetical protein